MNRLNNKELSLLDFPEAFSPLVIVTGDRREERPKSKGDLLAYSVSNIDFTYLLDLGLKGVPLVTDKTFVLADRKALEAEYGKAHILTIGSPAVNLLTRQINDFNPFYFDIPSDAKEDMKKHEKIIDEIKFSPDDLFIYKEIFERGLTSEEIVNQDFSGFLDKDQVALRCRQLYSDFKALNLSSTKWKQFIHSFDRPGIFDVVEQKKQAFFTTSSNDFGLISIAVNPFSNGNFFVITVAGIHGMATAHGMRILANKNFFKDRPFGGIYEVQFSQYASWPSKLREARVKWQTRPYKSELTLKDIVDPRPKLGQFGIFISSPYKEGDQYLIKLNGKLQAACEGYFLNNQTAYTIKTAGKTLFPEIIEHTIDRSSAIIHILNGFKPGVLFEVGLSIGHRKHAFLVWDKTLGKFDSSKIPKSIEKLTIIQFTPADDDEFRKKIIEEVIKPSLEMTVRPTSDRHLETVLAEINPDLSPDRVYFCISSVFENRREAIFRIAANYRFNPLAQNELKATGHLHAQCYGIRSVHRCVFVLDDDDTDGIVLLGIAKGLNKQVLLLRPTNLSMWKGDFAQITPALEKENLHEALQIFFSKSVPTSN